eukprot:TRINITY_DN3779_c0_g1_i3.p1 TRINITY_DN3779_c0_g1~~TRINITY_DN3779_c0_g1_i3.p1  ORF type:complete len:484 (-),score=94.10 TRINITY_DN3779_c0_g1_i3:814-2265(-)
MFRSIVSALGQHRAVSRVFRVPGMWQSQRNIQWKRTTMSKVFDVPEREAEQQFLLGGYDFEGLRCVEKPFPNPNSPLVRFFDKADLRTAALQRWGSFDRLEAEKRRLNDDSTNDTEDSSSGLQSYWRKDDELSRKRRYITDGAMLMGHHKSGNRAVIAAIIGNAIVMVGKYGAFLSTGSGSLLAEAVHSTADTFNQCLLAVGIQKSSRTADPTHPYGYAPERFVWALISATGVFFLGCGVSMYHGIATLYNPLPITEFALGFKVLAFSAVVEGTTFAIAVRSVQQAAREIGMTVREYISHGPDPMGVAVLMEDGAAVTGLAIAAGCLGMTAYTGNPMYDAMGSMMVGGLLGAVAIFLIRKNKDALLGRAIHPERMAQLLSVLKSNEVVSSVHDVKAITLGVGTVRFKAEIKFNSDVLAARYMFSRSQFVQERWDQVSTEDDVQNFLQQYSAGLLDFLGEEIDRIEADIKATCPEVRHVDLEVV